MYLEIRRNDMKIAVLGTGMVGNAIAGKLAGLSHEVMMGSRTADNETARAWADCAGDRASAGTFADAAAFADLVFNCVKGEAVIAALKMAGAENLNGKVLIDISNPLDFSKGMPPTLSVCNDSSLGEQIQAAFPSVKVVKALNTVNAGIMVNPSRISGDHDTFIAGNDADAKAQVTTILKDWFGWKHVIDLGPISNARGTEMYLPLWLRLYSSFGAADFNIHVVHAG